MDEKWYLTCTIVSRIFYTRLSRTGGVAQWVTRNVEVVGSSPPKSPPLDSLNKKLYPYCLELVGSRNGFERDIPIELK